jgi:hypothetical protein
MTVVEPQLILLPIGALLKVVKTTVAVLHLRTNIMMEDLCYRLTWALGH